MKKKTTPKNYYTTNTEIAEKFSVSEGAVRNWIKAAKEEKNLLQLTEINDRLFVLKNKHNEAELTKLAENAKLYRSTESEVTVEANPDIYNILTKNELIALINSINQRKQIPEKYSFKGRGADYWNSFYINTDTDNTNYVQVDGILLDRLYPYLELKFKEFDAINVIDLGPGEGSPVKDFLVKLEKEKKLNKYIPVDISDEMLRFNKQNISKYIPENKIDGYVKDLETDGFQDLLYKYKDYTGKRKIVNIILFLGGTIGNFWPLSYQSGILRSLRAGMFGDDILIISNGYDVYSKRTTFPAFEGGTTKDRMLYIPTLMSIKEEFYKEEFIYNELKGVREFNIVLNRNVNIDLKMINTTIKLKKNDKITLWNHKRDDLSVIEQKATGSDLEIETVIRHSEDSEDLIFYILKVKEEE
jgi:uncharacterized SAM-dependent methyltransferase